jgi:Zn finger protein HypA/HybF involved in hydrogenase expression
MGAKTEIEVTAEERAAMVEEYNRDGTSTCPKCGTKSQPWAGYWFCQCGAFAAPVQQGDAMRVEHGA